MILERATYDKDEILSFFCIHCGIPLLNNKRNSGIPLMRHEIRKNPRCVHCNGKLPLSYSKFITCPIKKRSRIHLFTDSLPCLWIIGLGLEVEVLFMGKKEGTCTVFYKNRKHFVNDRSLRSLQP